MSSSQSLVNIMQDELSWVSDANCLNMDTNLWFPEFGANYTPFAKEVCNSCLVSEECLWYANQIGAQDGMFGGLTPSERERWRSKNGVRLYNRRVM